MPFLKTVLVVAIIGISCVLAGRAHAQTPDHWAYLHEICVSAMSAPNSVVLKDSETECIFQTVAGNGTATFYNYFSNDNFCVRSVVVTPGSPKYDRTVCNPVPLPSAVNALEEQYFQGLGTEGLEGVDEAVRILGDEIEFVEGTVQLLKDSGTVPATPDMPVEPGDVILTGKAGFVDLISDGGAIWLSGDSTLGIAEIEQERPEPVIAPDEPLDPQTFQLEELSWWEKAGLWFAGKLDPDVYKTAEMYGFKKAKILYRGAAYIEEKTDGSTDPSMIVTPTAAIVPNGTVFLVEVEDDGETTVTTLDGEVLVADVRSGNVVSVGANEAVTVPKTAKGLSAEELQRGVAASYLQPIDRWWYDKITQRNLQSAAEAARAGEPSDQEAYDTRKMIFFGGVAVLIVIGFIVGSVIKSRSTSKKK